MQIPKISGFAINENAAKNLRNAAPSPFSRMDCIVAADFLRAIILGLRVIEDDSPEFRVLSG
jgi:hypothetical protein